jgi:hypothetical protein
VNVILQTAIVTFHEVDHPDVWRIDVVVEGAVAGHIDRAGGSYRYFEGPHNDVIWSFADLDLPRLESRIRASVMEQAPSDRPAPVQAD